MKDETQTPRIRSKKNGKKVIYCAADYSFDTAAESEQLRRLKLWSLELLSKIEDTNKEAYHALICSIYELKKRETEVERYAFMTNVLKRHESSPEKFKKIMRLLKELAKTQNKIVEEEQEALPLRSESAR